MLEHRYYLSVAFSICAIVLIIHIFLMYISKKKFKNLENSIFKYLLIGNACTIILEFIFTSALANIEKYPSIALFFCRLYHAAISLWLILFIFYILVLLTRKIDDVIKRKQIRNKILGILTSIYIVLQIILLLFPLEFYNYSKSLYVFGGFSSYIIVFLGIISMITLIIGIYKNNMITKKEKKLIYLCLLILLFLLVGQYFILKVDFNLENFMFSYLLATLYFTLENQDNMILEDLERSKKTAEAANRSQTEFLMSMSHEIRTPLNTIMGFTESLLNEEKLTEDIVKEEMDNIHSASLVLLGLINNILDISRMESGREQVIETEYDLKDFIFELNSVIKPRIPKEVEFEIKVDENIPKSYKGDYTKLNKIISNVLLNAINYTNYGKISLVVTKQENQLIFTIENTGNLMKESTFYKTFAEFVKVGVAQDNTVSSVTLGLMVAKQYAKMMNGSISFQSNEDTTKYTITLPIQVVNKEKIGNVFANMEKDTPKHKLFDLTGKNVLIVDDNAVNIKLAVRLLEGYHVSVDTAESGKTCIDKVRQKRYDMILLDHMMPDMDGVATLKLLKTHMNQLPPIIALTANFYSGIREEYIKQGFTDYLAKPISYKELNKIMYECFMKNKEEKIVVEKQEIDEEII